MNEFKDSLHHLPYAISIHKPDRTIVYENLKMIEVFGPNTGRPCYSRWYGDNSEEMKICVECPFEVGLDRRDVGTIRSVIMPDGKFKLLHILHHNLESENGEAEFFFEIINDITDMNDNITQYLKDHELYDIQNIEISLERPDMMIISTFHPALCNNLQIKGDIPNDYNVLTGPHKGVGGGMNYQYQFKKGDERSYRIIIHASRKIEPLFGYKVDINNIINSFIANFASATCIQSYDLIGLKMQMVSELYKIAKSLKMVSY